MLITSPAQLEEFVIKGTSSCILEVARLSSTDIYISQPRKSKLGDFRPGRKKHKITVNNDLTKPEFTITLLHELAHATNWIKHRQFVKPHGIEWKNEFREIIQHVRQTTELSTLEDQLLSLVYKKPTANRWSNPDIVKFTRAQSGNTDLTILNDLPTNAHFKLKGIQYVKISKRRTRHLCRNLSNNREYLIQGLAEIEPIYVKE